MRPPPVLARPQLKLTLSLAPRLSLSPLPSLGTPSLVTYHWRANAIRKRGSGPYDDRLGASASDASRRAFGSSREESQPLTRALPSTHRPDRTLPRTLCRSRHQLYPARACRLSPSVFPLTRIGDRSSPSSRPSRSSPPPRHLSSILLSASCHITAHTLYPTARRPAPQRPYSSSLPGPLVPVCPPARPVPAACVLACVACVLACVRAREVSVVTLYCLA